jgi:hypothetical protein
MGGILRPSICSATTIKRVLIVPLNATIFEKFTLTKRYKYNYIHCTTDGGGRPQIYGKACGRPQIIKKPVCGGADRRRKIGGFTVPVAAASQIAISRWQIAHH